MTVELETQIEAFARWMEEGAGVPLRKATARAVIPSAPGGEPADTIELVAIPIDGTRWRRPLLLAVAMIATLVAARSIALRREQTVTPAASTGSNGNVRTEVTWYGLAADTPLLRNEVVKNESGLLLCRERDEFGGCSTLVGSRSVTYAPSRLSVTTEYGPAVSLSWQILNLSAERVDVSGKPGVVGRDGSVAGFEPTSGVRVIVTDPTGSPAVDILRSLEPRTTMVDLPVVFGETTSTEAEFPKSRGPSVRYLAGYLDARRGCIGGMSLPWNNEETCVPFKPDSLQVVMASPSPAGTVLIATVPKATARVEASRNGQQPRVLSIVDASAGYRVVFADLDAFAPDTLTVFDEGGVVIGSTSIVSTGGAALGYVQNEDSAGPRVAVTDTNVSDVVSRLGVNVPLPPGVSLADIAAKLVTNSDIAESTMAAVIEFNAACRWTTYWLDSITKGDATGKAAAQSHLDSLTDRPALLVGDGDGGVANMWRNIAAAARANDPVAVAEVGYGVNCTDVSLQQPTR
jgi:hypothetical protein